MNSKTLFEELISAVTLNVTVDEKRGILHRLLEAVSGVPQTDILAGKHIPFDQTQARQLSTWIDRINQEEPLQYILGKCEFYGRVFNINRQVLIPRPETEELVKVALSDLHGNGSPGILDVGTGSGCIAVTLSLEVKGSRVYGIDIDAKALALAAENAELLGAKVTFSKIDVLSAGLPFKSLDMIISNPPYIATSEKGTLQRNVRDYEPAHALFVPDGDQLIFYKAILSQAKPMLNSGGIVVVEINEKLGPDVRDAFIAHGLKEVEIITDISGKDRIVRGVRH